MGVTGYYSKLAKQIIKGYKKENKEVITQKKMNEYKGKQNKMQTFLISQSKVVNHSSIQNE